MAKKTYHGSCHCKRVTFEADIDLEKGTGKCNCTNCWKKRLWTTRAPLEDFRALTGDEDLGKPGGAGWFCKHCGVMVYTLVPKADWNDGAYYSVNVSALDDLDPAELVAAPLTLYDGLHNNWWNPPAESRHL